MIFNKMLKLITKNENFFRFGVIYENNFLCTNQLIILQTFILVVKAFNF